MKNELISVLVPIHNTEKYVEECLRSIMNQTYKNLEIICIDSSTDGTTEIVKKLASEDERIVYVFDPNGSYGHKLNVALEKSTGAYIGIIDSDDYLELNMYERLLEVIQEQDVDFVKSDYSSFYVEKGKNIIFERNHGAADPAYYNVAFNVSEKPNILYQNSVAIWSGLYKKSFIDKNKITVNETPGASFQDTGFSVLTHLFAEKMYYIPETFYRYRTDNAGSSVKSKSKNLIIADEWKFIDGEIERVTNLTPEALLGARIKKIVAYQWNYERLDYEGSLEFAQYVHEELQKQYMDTGLYEKMPEYMKKRFDQVYRLEEMMKKVSVIVPIYNVAQYLEECLDSLLKQDFHNIEIICVNDGSTDDSAKILKKYSELDERIKVVTQENQGLSGARNTGIAAATGDYLLFLDGDDMLEPNTVSVLVHNAVETKAEIVSFDARILYMDGEPTDPAKKIDNYYQRPISYGLHEGKELLVRLVRNRDYCDSACLLLISKQWLQEANMSFYRGILHEDCLFWVQCMIKAPHVMHINERFYIYRVRANSIMNSGMGAANVYGKLVCYKHFVEMLENEDLTREQERALRKFTRVVYWSISNIALKMPFEERKKLASYPLDMFMKNLLDNIDYDWNSYEDYYDLRKAIIQAKQIEIYGAGVWGKRILALCRMLDCGDKVSNFVVTERNGQPANVVGIPVYSCKEKYNVSKKSLLIVGIRGEAGEEVVEKYNKKGHSDLIQITDALNKCVMEDLRGYVKEMYL